MFVDCKKLEELEVPLKCKDEEVRKKGLMGMKRNIRVVVKSAKLQRTFIAALHEPFAEFIDKELWNPTIAFPQRFADTTTKQQNWYVKWIIILTSWKECRTYPEHDVVDRVTTHPI